MGDGEDFSLPGDSSNHGWAGVVFANVEVAGWGDGDVVAVLEQVCVVGLEGEFGFSFCGILAGEVTEDLAGLVFAAVGAEDLGEQDRRALFVPRDFATGRARNL